MKNNTDNLFKIDKGTKFYCDWIKYWSGLWAELRGLRNLLDSHTKRISKLEHDYYNTNGG